MAKFLAPCSERNEPEILVWSLAHAEVSLALVVIKIYGEVVDEAEDLVLAVAEGHGEVVDDLLGPGPFASVGRFWVGGESIHTRMGSGPPCGPGGRPERDGRRDRPVVFLAGDPISFASIAVSRFGPLGPRRHRVMAVMTSFPSSVLGGVPAPRYGSRYARRGNAARRSPLKAWRSRR